MTNEQKRRLDALDEATRHITCCEFEYEEWSEDSREPFSQGMWTNVSGEVNVIYDRSGNVERIVRHDCESGYEQREISIGKETWFTAKWEIQNE